MSLTLTICGQSKGKSYVGWAPQPISLSLSPAQQTPQNVIVRSSASSNAGSVQFLTAKGKKPVPELPLVVPADGTVINAFVAGSTASFDDQDVTITVADAATGAVLATRTIMVRVRKNANTLTDDERNRFLNAYLQLNLTTSSPSYNDFLIMHGVDADAEIHTVIDRPRYSFLVWHRAFILDLERQLQKFDASVALHYWKIDEKAPNVFNELFMGRSKGAGTVTFDANNPLFHWEIRGKSGFVRDPRFDQDNDSALVSDDASTVALGTTFKAFSAMEGDPHGQAHASFSTGPISIRTTANEDPLFYLLHSNVDRLWARWQVANKAYDRSDADSYPLSGTFIRGTSTHRIGDYVNDTMWPWNGDKRSPTSTRPKSAPGGQFTQLAVTAAPGAVPAVGDMMDYQGYLVTSNMLFDYDDINYDYKF